MPNKYKPLAGILVNCIQVMLAFKSIWVWLKLLAGLFFLSAAVDRAIHGGILPGPWPTVFYALFGSRLIFDGLRSGRKSLDSSSN